MDLNKSLLDLLQKSPQAKSPIASPLPRSPAAFTAAGGGRVSGQSSLLALLQQTGSQDTTPVKPAAAECSRPTVPHLQSAQDLVAKLTSLASPGSVEPSNYKVEVEDVPESPGTELGAGAATAAAASSTSKELNPSMFKIVNPFDHLSATTPRPKRAKTGSEDEGSSGLSKSQALPAVSVPVAEMINGHEGQVGAGKNQLLDSLLFDGKKDVDVPSAPLVPAVPAEQSDKYTIPQTAFMSYTIPHLSSTSIPALAAHTEVRPITRQKRTYDPTERQIIAATMRYVAYALPETSATPGIRLIDQENGAMCLLRSEYKEKIVNLEFWHGKGKSDGIDARLRVTNSVGAVYVYQVTGELKGDNEPYVVELGFEGDPAEIAVKPRARWNPINSDAVGVSFGMYLYNIPEFARNVIRRDGLPEGVADDVQVICADKSLKDFAFSDDGSTIATVDKLAIKLWPQDASSGSDQRIMQCVPELVYTAITSDKLTSVRFIDVDDKGPARYLLVGARHNHDLQLWDIELGTCVQQLSFASEETNRMACIGYHQATQTVVVSCAARKSLYFLHLTAPARAGQEGMSQAEYCRHVSKKAQEITVHDANVRSAAFEYVAENRFDTDPAATSAPSTCFGFQIEESYDDANAFEMFVYHEGGFTAFGCQSSLFTPGAAPTLQGTKLDPESEPARRKNKPRKLALDRRVAPGDEDLGVTTSISATRPTSSSAAESQLTEAELQRRRSSIMITESVEQIRSPTATRTPQPDDLVLAAAWVSATEGPENVVAEVVRQLEEKEAAQETEPAGESTVESYVSASESAAEPASVPSVTSSGTMTNVDMTAVTEGLKALELNLQTKLDNAFTAQARRLEEDRLVQAAADQARQETILKVVSETLSKNTGKLIQTTINNTIQQQVLPALSTLVNASLEQNLTKALKDPLEKALPKELFAVVNASVQQALTQPELTASIATAVGKPLVGAVETSFKAEMLKLVGDIEQKAVREIQAVRAEAEQQRAADGVKIDALTASVGRMEGLLQALMEREATATPAAVSAKEKSEADQLEDLIAAGAWEDAFSLWIQSENVGGLFGAIAARFQPEILEDVLQIHLLSFLHVVSLDMDDRSELRLLWLEKAMSLLKDGDAQIKQIAPKILGQVAERLDDGYTRLASKGMKGVILRRLAAVIDKMQSFAAL
ncbi:hypothetical protein YB2330_002009 [Saitoella coloradoensis]